MGKFLVNFLWRKLEPLVDLCITGRIVIFHRALVARGQIKRPMNEEILESPTVDCKQVGKLQ
jgi:hypothetical protein